VKPGVHNEQIVLMLQQNGRASFSELARKLQLPRSVVAKQVTDLIDSGALQLVAAVHPRVLGLNALAHISIRLDGAAHSVVDHLLTLDAAAFVSQTTGQYSLVAELRYPTMAELYQGIDAIRAIPEVGDTNVLIYHDVLRSFFLQEEPDLPDLTLDDVDLQLITELQVDGRLSFGELGRRVGLSVSAARSRVHNLIESHVLQIGAIRGRGQASQGNILGFGITTSGSAPAVLDVINQIPGVEFIARCFGNFDLVVTFAASDLYAATDILDSLRELPEVDAVTSWVHLRIVKEHYNMSFDQLPKRYPAPSRRGGAA